MGNDTPLTEADIVYIENQGHKVSPPWVKTLVREWRRLHSDNAQLRAALAKAQGK